MTQPIQEPSLERADTKMQFGIDQLFRRPAPRSSVSVVYFRAVRYLSSVSVGTGGTRITVDWDEWEFCNEDVFTPLNTALGDAEPGEQVRRVKLHVDDFPGRYTMVFSAHNTSDIPGTLEMAMEDGDPIWSRPDSYLHANGTSLSVGFYTAVWPRIYPTYDPFGSGPQDIQISFTLAQTGGSTELFSELLMEIHYESYVDMCPPNSS